MIKMYTHFESQDRNDDGPIAETSDDDINPFHDQTSCHERHGSVDKQLMDQ